MLVCGQSSVHLTVILRTCTCVCVCVSYLVEQWTVCDGNTQRSEASAQHHVIRSIITVAATPTGNKPGHSHSTEDHPTQRQKKGSG